MNKNYQEINGLYCVHKHAVFWTRIRVNHLSNLSPLVKAKELQNIMKLDNARNSGKHSSVNSILRLSRIHWFHRRNVKWGRKCWEISGDAVGRILTIGCRPGRECNGSLTKLTALITSAFVPGLFLRRIVGPSAIFILPVVALGRPVRARSAGVETDTSSPRFPLIDTPASDDSSHPGDETSQAQ